MSKRKVVAVIPARMASSRFPGKPLAKILALPMIEHVRRRVALSKMADAVYVATCDKSIIDAVENYGGKAVMTSESHTRCIDRTAEAIGSMDLNDDDIVAIISGDEPLFSPELLDILVEPFFKDPSLNCTNIVSIITDAADMQDKDIVKSVLDLKGRIMCFSRAPLPFQRVKNFTSLYRQTGLYAFTKSFLLKFAQLPQTPLEITESVDMMRILEHGYDIQGVVYNRKIIGVDQKEHVALVEDVLRKDYEHQRIYQAILNA
jgi:3-deoxy-manno-octulosonate cytidylyltransferase (CMP-KDO synthetase)